MLKMGLTFTLGVNLGFASFQASLNEIDTALVTLNTVNFVVIQLEENQVTLKIEDVSRLRDMINFREVSYGTVEDLRNRFEVDFRGMNTILADAYILGIALALAESQSNTHDENARPIVNGAVATAISTIQSLLDGTPKVPLDLTNLPGDLQSIDLKGTFDYLYTTFLFERGKCQGALDVLPDPF